MRLLRSTGEALTDLVDVLRPVLSGRHTLVITYDEVIKLC